MDKKELDRKRKKYIEKLQKILENALRTSRPFGMEEAEWEVLNKSGNIYTIREEWFGRDPTVNRLKLTAEKFWKRHFESAFKEHYDYFETYGPEEFSLKGLIEYS